MNDERVDAMLKKVADDIMEVGQSIIGVFGDGDHPSFSYTVGLTVHEHPELLSFSLPPRVAQQLLNDLSDRSRLAPLEPGYYDDVVALFPVALINVDPGKADQYVTMPHSFFRDDELRGVMQLVWTDKRGMFPWDQDYAFAPEVQPVLGTPPPRPPLVCGGVIND